MKKLISQLAIATTVAFTSSAFAEQDYQGHRVGLGLSSGKMDSIHYDGNTDIGNGIKIEYGYDFNRIVGLNVSLDKNKDDESFEGYKFYESNVSTFKVDADIGYAFFIDNFTIKPYGAIGAARIKDKETFVGETFSSTDTSLLLGMGVRATLDFGLYVDIRSNFMMLEDADLDQLSLTVGYKF